MIVFGTCDSTTTSSPSLVTPSESSSVKMGDLEDLNRTLYDIGAQDLLDVWDAMETEVRFQYCIKFEHKEWLFGFLFISR